VPDGPEGRLARPEVARFLAPDPTHKPHRVRRHVRPVFDHWAARIVVDEAMRPEPGSPKGTAFFGETQ